MLNGVAQGTNQEIDVTRGAALAAELSVRLGRRHLVGARQRRHAVERLVEQLHGDGAKSTPRPTVTGSNVTAARGQSFAASSLFTASDADGDAITKYAFWDTGAGGGHFVLNGVAQGASQEIDVTAAQLSQLSYQSGSGADTLWVRGQ